MGNARMVYLGKDAVASLTKTDFPDSVPELVSDEDISEIFILSGVTATATSPQTIDEYNATDWDTSWEPSAAGHIMVSVADRQWKANDALVDGDLLVAMVFLGASPEVEVLTQRLLGMLGTFGTDWHLLTAGAFVTMLFPLIVFFSLQRYFVRGLLAGSVKG